MRLGLARSREGNIQFFLKDYEGCTRVIKCHDCDLIHDVVVYGGWDMYATLHGHILDLSGTLVSQGVSEMTLFGSLADSVVDRTTLTFLDSGSVQIVMQRVVGQCDAIATGAERPVLTLLLLLLLGILVREEGVAKALLAETPCLDPATCRTRFGNRVSCLLVDRLVLRLGPHQVMLILLRYLEICFERTSFFKQSCLRRTSPSCASF